MSFVSSYFLNFIAIVALIPSFIHIKLVTSQILLAGPRQFAKKQAAADRTKVTIMGLVSTWLNGIGLRSVVPTFEAAGIVSPAHLADLDVSYFESLGVTDPDDRRKLFYLVQRIKMAVKDKSSDGSSKGDGRGIPSGRAVISVEERVDAVVSKNYVSENDDDKACQNDDSKYVEKNSENTLREEEEEEEKKVVEPTRRSKRIRTLVKKHKKKKKDDTKENINNNETETPAPIKDGQNNSPSKSPSKSRTKRIKDEQESSPSKSPSKRRTKSIKDEQENSPSKPSSKRRTKSIKDEHESSPSKPSSKCRTKITIEEQECSSSKSPSKRRTKSIKDEQESTTSKPPSKRRTTNIKEEQDSSPSKPPSKRSSMKEKISKLSKYKKNSKEEEVKVNHKDNVPSRSNPISSKTDIPSSISAFSEQSGNDSVDNNSDEFTNSIIEKGPTRVTPATVQTSQKINLSQNKPPSRQPPKSKLQEFKRTEKRLPAASSQPTTESQSPAMECTSSAILNGDIDDFQSSSSSSSHDISRQKRRTTLAASIDSLENHFQPPISELMTGENNNHKNTNVIIEENNENSATTTSNNNYNINQSRSIPKPTTSRSSKSMSASDSMLLQKHQRCHQTLPTISSSTRVHSSKQDRSSIITQSSNEIVESWATQIDYLREDNAAEHDMFRDQVETENEYYDMRIKVIIRKRPLSKSEARQTGGIDIIHPLDYGSYGRILAYQPKTRVDLTKEVETVPFAFDNVFDESSTNIGIYERSLRNLVEPFFNGQWATVFAYGQTGSGKTYTMMGSNITGVNAGTADESNLGLYYLAALDIFKMMEMPEYSHLKVHVSLFEIYSGKLFDLLNERKQIKCLEDSKGKVCFPGLTEHPVHAPEHVMQLIEEGAANRSTGTTSRNADSSRSHAVLQIKLMKKGRKQNIEHGRFTFIDLAGSERGADTSNSSKATRLEGAEINTSLLALKEVIRALATGGSMSHIPFRGSKLTQVLKDSFVGENSRSCMVACISPDIGNCDQTLNTLRYADRVKERNPESGDLPTTCQQPTKQKPIQCSRLSTKQPPQQQRSMIDHNSRIERFEDQVTNDLVDEIHHIDVGAKCALEALTEPPNIPKAKAKAKPPRKVNVTEKQEAGQALVSNHRSVMSRWLKMVKDEMNSVNQVDAERDGIDNYLLELQNLQRAQIDFISELRSSLQTYVSASEGQFQTVADHDDDDSFESFDDLRD